jgi:hypothetical protein
MVMTSAQFPPWASARHRKTGRRRSAIRQYSQPRATASSLQDRLVATIPADDHDYLCSGCPLGCTGRRAEVACHRYTAARWRKPVDLRKRVPIHRKGDGLPDGDIVQGWLRGISARAVGFGWPALYGRERGPTTTTFTPSPILLNPRPVRLRCGRPICPPRAHGGHRRYSRQYRFGFGNPSLSMIQLLRPWRSSGRRRLVGRSSSC